MADYNAIDTTEDGQRKQVHSGNEVRSPSLMGSNKDQGEVGTQGTRLGESLENGKGGEVLPTTKKRKDQTKTSTRRTSVTIEVLPHPRRQKSFLLVKGINLEERSASIASAHLLHLVYHRHPLPRSLQRQKVETGRWVADSKLYLRKISADVISPLT